MLVFSILVIATSACLANDNLFKEARTLQSNGSYDEAIDAYKNYLSIELPVYIDWERRDDRR